MPNASDVSNGVPLPRIDLVLVVKPEAASGEIADNLIQIPHALVGALYNTVLQAQILNGAILTTPQQAEDFVNALLSTIDDGQIWSAQLVDGEYSVWDAALKIWERVDDSFGALLDVYRNDETYPGPEDGCNLDDLVIAQVSVSYRP
jgi:hypothetical protein